MNLISFAADSCPVTINACTLGSVARNTAADSSSLFAFPKKWLLMKTPKQGAQTIIYLSVEPKLRDISGELFEYVPHPMMNSIVSDSDHCIQFHLSDCEKQSPPSVLQNAAAIDALMTGTQKVLKIDFLFKR